MLSQCLVPYITKQVSSYSLVMGQQTLKTVLLQTFHRIMTMYPKIIKNFLNFYRKAKEAQKNCHLTSD